eukprot:1552959-Rhodomonas_salina.1
MQHQVLLTRPYLHQTSKACRLAPALRSVSTCFGTCTGMGVRAEGERVGSRQRQRRRHVKTERERKKDRDRGGERPKDRQREGRARERGREGEREGGAEVLERRGSDSTL